jgi:protein gp37
MGKETGISWTDHTFNLVWGCERVSPGCAHCYAADLSARYGFDVWGKGPKHGKGDRRTLSAAYWKEPLKWNRLAERQGISKRVFCSSMADVFEDHPTVDREREKLWPLIEATPYLDWLILTKRPERIKGNVPWDGLWPDNVWIGTSVENQHWAMERVPIIAEIPAPVKFISCEPLLGPVDLRNVDGWDYLYSDINWVIAGGESGPKHRPMHLEWAQSLRNQCDATGTAFFFKQWGGATSKSGGDVLDGKTHHAWPYAATIFTKKDSVANAHE